MAESAPSVFLLDSASFKLVLSAVHRTALWSLVPLALALVIPVWMMAACTNPESGSNTGAGGDTTAGGDGGGEPNATPDHVDVPLPGGGAGGAEGGTAGSAAQAGMGGAVVPGTPGTGGSDPWSILPARSQGCGKAAQGAGSYVRKEMQIGLGATTPSFAARGVGNTVRHGRA